MGRDRSYSRSNPLPQSKNRFVAKTMADIWLQIFDVLLVILIAGCPFLFAGRHALGQFAYSVVAGLLSLTWLARQQTKYRQPWLFTGLEIWGLLAVILCAVQLIPLPDEIINQLAPEQGRLLFQFHQQVPAEIKLHLSWHTLSLDPYETAQNLGTICMFLLAGISIRQRVRSNADIIRISILIGIAGGLVTVFALAQYYFSNGKFFWFYQHYQTTTFNEVKGPFTNANHFAGFACLSLIPTLLMGFYFLFKNEAKDNWHRSSTSGRNSDHSQFLSAIGCFSLFLLLVIAATLSVSRGAIILLAGEMIFLCLVFCVKRIINGKILLALLGLAFIGSLSLFLMADKIFEANSRELLTTTETEQLDPNAGRRIIWQGNLKMIQSYPLFGTGLGSHADVHTAYIEPYLPGIKFTHAENSYLNIASEAGCLVFGISLIFLLAPILWNVSVLYESRDRKRILISTGLLMGLIVLYTHAMYDFNFYAPAISLIFLLTLVLSHQIYSEHRGNLVQTVPVSRSPILVFAYSRIAVTACFTVVTLLIQLPPALAAYDWETYLRLSRIHHQEQHDERALFVVRLKHLQKIVQTHPRHALAQTELAQMYLQAVRIRLKNQSGSLPINQIKDSAHHGGFNSISAMQEWLAKPKILGAYLPILLAVKQRALYSLSLNPTQYEALILLSEVGFVDGMDQTTEELLLKQAVNLAPHQAEVQLAAGMFYWQNGEYETAQRHLKSAFGRSSKISQQIVNSLAGEISVEEFLQFFEPDLKQMGYLANHYASRDEQESLVKVSAILGEGYVAKAERYQGREKSIYLLQAAEHYTRANLIQEALMNFQHALDISPHDREIKTRYACFLFKQNDYAAALPHLEWAYQHAPENKQLREYLDICLKHQLSNNMHKGIYR